MARVALLLVIAPLLSGCEDILVVEAQLEPSPPGPCTLYLIDVSSNEVRDSTTVTTTIHADFVISPWGDDYRIRVLCPSGIEYQSRKFHSREAEEIDLGVLRPLTVPVIE